MTGSKRWGLEVIKEVPTGIPEITGGWSLLADLGTQEENGPDSHNRSLHWPESASLFCPQ